MRATFESRLEDITRIAMRRHFGTRSVRRVELGFGAATSLLLASATGLEVGGVRGIAAGAAAAVASFFLYRAAARVLQRWLIARNWRPLYGNDGRTPVELDVAAAALRVKYRARELQVPWPNVREVTDDGQHIALHAAGGPIVAVPHEAFPDAASRNAFLEALRVHTAR